MGRSAPLDVAVAAAIDRREELLARLHGEGTDCYRLFHGVAEGRPGTTLDRYGPLLVVRARRHAPSPSELENAHHVVCRRLGVDLRLSLRADGGTPAPGTASGAATDPPCGSLQTGALGHECGLPYAVDTAARGVDPPLFLDLRAGRRLLAETAAGRTVLNLFAYTCSAGVAAAKAGAASVLNVDFARSALEIGRANATRNAIAPDVFGTLCEDVFPVVRQLAGLPVKGRGARRGYARLSSHAFDIVVLDPPEWSTSPFGAVDLVRDYESLFKPAVLSTRPGGHVLATNHSADVSLADWLERLRRCAAKAGRAIASMEVIAPDEDFPSFDGRPPLKVAWVRLAA
jgi:23S rRNA (cytosine1962-C5)-methyltransferase